MTARRIVVVATICALGGHGRPIALAAGDTAAGPTGQTAKLVAAATEAFTALHYDDALQLADQAWRSGGSDPAQVRRLFALAGRAAAAIGDGDAARLWFGRWLYLEPTATLPDGTSPKLIALFDAAGGELAGAAIAARTVVRSGTITVTVAADPLGLVAAVRGGASTVALRDRAASVPAREAGPDIELVDRHGNTLLVVTSASPAPPPPAPPRQAPTSPPAPAAARRAGRWFARWPVWAVTSGGLAALGGGALWLAVRTRADIEQLNLHSADHEFSDLRPYEQRFQGARLVSGIAFTGAALSAIATVVLWSRSGDEPTTQISITPRSVLWSVGF